MPRHCSAALVLAAAALWPACNSTPPPPREPVRVARPVGTWHGTGNKLIGSVIGDSGRFHITWETRNERVPGTGTFRLTVRSGTSGRSLETVVDHRGEGHGAVDFVDTPRTYDFVVDSTGVDWSFTVDEIFVGVPG